MVVVSSPLSSFVFRSCHLVVRDEGEDHSVQGVKEEYQVETELEEGFLLVRSQGPEYFCRVVHVVPIDDFVDVVGEQGYVEQEGDELERDEEQGRHERVRRHFRQDELEPISISTIR